MVLNDYNASVELLRPSVAFLISQSHERNWAFLNKVRARSRLMDWLVWDQTERHTWIEELIPRDLQEGPKFTEVTRKA